MPVQRADLHGLPPAYVEVGDADMFYAEDVAYALSLITDHVPTELIVRPGVVHGFEPLAPSSALTERSIADRIAYFRWVLAADPADR